MRTDPVEIIGHSISGMVLRTALAWLAVWIGFALAGFTGFQSFTESLKDSLSAAPLLPLVILTLSVASGWWSWIALPAALVLGYRALTFISREGGLIELLLLVALSLAVCLKHGDFGDNLILLGIAFAVLCYAKQREEEEAVKE
jgi:hypothetical protein